MCEKGYGGPPGDQKDRSRFEGAECVIEEHDRFEKVVGKEGPNGSMVKPTFL